MIIVIRSKLKSKNKNFLRIVVGSSLVSSSTLIFFRVALYYYEFKMWIPIEEIFPIKNEEANMNEGTFIPMVIVLLFMFISHLVGVKYLKGSIVENKYYDDIKVVFQDETVIYCSELLKSKSDYILMKYYIIDGHTVLCKTYANKDDVKYFIVLRYSKELGEVINIPQQW